MSRVPLCYLVGVVLLSILSPRLDDEEVPYTVSLDLSRRVQSTNVNLYLIKVRRIKHRLRDASRLLSVASDGYPQLLVCENL